MAIRITKFGGIAPRVADRNKKESVAIIAENIDFSHGTLKPFREPKKVDDKTGEKIHYRDCCWVTGDCKSSFCNFGHSCSSITIATGIEDYPTYTDDCENWYRLGFPCDLKKPTATTLDDVDVSFETEHRAYYYTLYNEKLDWESQPSYPSDLIEVNPDTQVVLTGIENPSGFEYTHIKIYASRSGLDYGVKQQDKVSSDFLFAGMIEKGTTSFADDGSVIGDMCTTEYFDPPPSDLRSVDSWRTGRIAGLSGNSFVMSERNKPYAFNDRYKIAFDSVAKKLICTDEKAYVLTDGKPFVVQLVGDCEENQKPTRLNDTLESMPIISVQSAVEYEGSVIYASDNGLCIVSGKQQQVLTHSYMTDDDWKAIHPHTMKGAVHDGYYYGATDNAFIRFRLVDNQYFKDDESRLSTLSLKPTAIHQTEQGRLYLAFEDGIYEWNEGDDYLEMHWRSKVLTQRGITRFTAFKQIARGSGNVITHYVNTKAIQTYEHKTNQPVRLPSGYRGLDWQVDIKGTSEVLEYHLSESLMDLSLQ